MYLRLVPTVLIIGLVFALSACTTSAPTAALEPSPTPAVVATATSLPTQALAPTPTSPPALTSTPPPPTRTSLPAPTSTPIPGEKQAALVLRVVDGDTIVVEMKGKRYRVRYIGIDTPETHHPTEGADYWGFEATDANRALVKEGTTVTLQRDISETDIYGRLLRYVFVDGMLVNAELVRMGLARVLFYEPDVLYKSEIKAAEREAKEARRGLYGPVPTPPAKKPLLYKGSVWTVSSSGAPVPLYYDPARGEPEIYFPPGVQARLVDSFWVPERQEWWYWIGVNGFNGWTNDEFISRSAPETTADGPPVWIDAYDKLKITAQTQVYALPSRNSDLVTDLQAGASVQVRRLSWEEATGAWWYHIESAEAEGWIRSEDLTR